MQKKSIEFCGILKGESGACWFVFDGVEETAIPKSRVERMRRIRGDDYELTIPWWLARKKGIM